MTDYYVGLMSGTSMDGIDAVLLEDDQVFRVTNHHSTAYRPETATLLDRIVTSQQTSLHDLLLADQYVAEDFAHCAQGLLAKLERPVHDALRAVGMHGQTIFHAPQIQQTLQIGNPNHVAATLGIPVVADIRRADLCAGGQGAPLAPSFHNQAFRAEGKGRVILNLGGIANATLLPGEPDKPAVGFDTGPASTLMDVWAQQHLNKPFDSEGSWARSGQCSRDLLDSMLSDSYFAARPPKSTGREYFHRDWLTAHLDQATDISAADVQATLCELTVITVADAIEQADGKGFDVYVCGGGWQNNYLMERMQLRLGETRLDSTASLGIPPQLVEGAAFAWIARQHLHSLPANLPAVTGADRPVILGALYPGNTDRSTSFRQRHDP